MDFVSVGFDIGHSSAKISWAAPKRKNQRGSITFPTLVTPWKHLSHDATRKEAELDTVTIGENKWFVGRTALTQGRAQAYSGESQNWVETDVHDALIVGGIRKVLYDPVSGIGGKPLEKMIVVMGLPSAFYESQRAILQERAYKLIRAAVPTATQIEIRVLSQGEGPLMAVSFDENGEPDDEYDLENETWGVVECGHFTCDLALQMNGAMVEDASGSCEGMSHVYALVSSSIQAIHKDFSGSLLSVEKAIMTNFAKINGVDVDVTEIVANAKASLHGLVGMEASRRFGTRKDMIRGVLVAGGGATVVAERLSRDFTDVRIASKPRFSVAEGFCRLGLFMQIAGDSTDEAA